MKCCLWNFKLGQLPLEIIFSKTFFCIVKNWQNYIDGPIFMYSTVIVKIPFLENQRFQSLWFLVLLHMGILRIEILLKIPCNTKFFCLRILEKKRFNISKADFSALEYAYALKIRLYRSFLTLNKIIIKIFCFSKISNSLRIRSESSQIDFYN